MKLVFLTKYGELGASSRMRVIQYINYLKLTSVQHNHFITDKQLQKKYATGKYTLISLIFSYCTRLFFLIRSRNIHNVLWVEKELMPWVPAWIEKLLLYRMPYILDYDDALFHNYDLHKNYFVRWLYGKKLDSLMKGSALVIAGNSYLAQRALNAGAKKVEIVPTVVDIDRYQINSSQEKSSDSDGIIRIVWIGSPSTVHYLLDIRDSLKTLANKINFELHLIGAPSNFVLNGVKIKHIKWAENTEKDSISRCDIGIMPLQKTPWELGKCGYKLIQYMACGLPTVASAIGANKDIVIQNETGFLVDKNEDWVKSLENLILNKSLRKSLGNNGRTRVEQKYSLQVTSLTVSNLLKDVAMISKG